MDVHNFDVRLLAPIELTARPARGCVVGVDTEIKRFVAKYVVHEIEEPAIRAARTINVGAQITRSWGGVEPSA